MAVVMYFGGIGPLSGGMGVELFVGMKLYQPQVQGNIYEGRGKPEASDPPARSFGPVTPTAREHLISSPGRLESPNGTSIVKHGLSIGSN